MHSANYVVVLVIFVFNMIASAVNGQRNGLSLQAEIPQLVNESESDVVSIVATSRQAFPSFCLRITTSIT